jgi:hypothetical protein
MSSADTENLLRKFWITQGLPIQTLFLVMGLAVGKKGGWKSRLQ